MTDKELHNKLLGLVREERRVLADILTHLKEVERRKLYCDFKRTSLFDYAVKELGYSEDQAQRRIEAMRLLKDLPEIAPAIRDGRLTITNIAQANRLFRHTQPTRDERVAFIKSIENKTKREVEREIAAIAPELPKPERARATTASTSRLALELPNETLELITQLKGALAHKYPNMTTAELITLLAQEKLTALRPAPARNSHAPTDAVQPAPARNTHASPKRSRYVPNKLRRKIQHEAQHKCANCGSQHALEVDHIHPFAQGGTHTPANLRTLCRNCNQRRIRRSSSTGAQNGR
ncbi:MAG TPA: HNH endonuclease signature motif containing protein [Pseudobdellovibrionaceae bacterium]|nr:HNH endonuclease signature motif containing protein [Pseudobdellovibrionaceae bacterium]